MDKKLVIIVVVLVLVIVSLLVLNNAKTSVSGNVVNEGNVGDLHEAKLEIEGMYCEACAYAVKAQLEELEGVLNADIDYKNAQGTVKYDADRVDPSTIAAASTAYPTTIMEDNKINNY